MLALCLVAFGAAATVLQPHPPPLEPLPPFVSVVDVNRANAATLAWLPGIGPVLAERIIAEREAGGPFRSLAELQRVKGIGPVLAERVRFMVMFGP